AAARPEFGVRAQAPLVSGHVDRTEIDMRWGELLVEAKLTESDFQAAPRALVEQYRDYAHVFERRLLPRTRGQCLHYQLIRNVLAAHACGGAFCVLLDARRPDLLEAWYTVLRAIRAAELRTRCKALTWQELAASLPRAVATFLRDKYGIA